MKTRRVGCRWDCRPNGIDATYCQLSTWPKKRIVWEFIRRNSKYQRACDQAAAEQRTGEIDGAPSEYGSNVPLRDLVDYTQDWEVAEAQLHFAIPRTTKNSEEAESDPKRFLTVQLDIHKLVRNPWMLEVRFAEIKKKAQKRMEQYARQAGREIVVPRFHPDAVARSLRYLDMVAAGVSTRRMKDAFYPGKSSDDQDRMLDKDKKRAIKYSKGHVAFLLLEELAGGIAEPVPTAKSAELRAGAAL